MTADERVARILGLDPKAVKAATERRAQIKAESSPFKADRAPTYVEAVHEVARQLAEEGYHVDPARALVARTGSPRGWAADAIMPSRLAAVEEETLEPREIHRRKMLARLRESTEITSLSSIPTPTEDDVIR